jgi:hypothetical protein
MMNGHASECAAQLACCLSWGWGLIDLPLRAAFSPAHPLARRDVPLALARALNSLNLYLEERPRLPFTARIERAQFHRARSASKKGTWPLPPHPSEAARCASTEDHQAPSPSLLADFFNSLLGFGFDAFNIQSYLDLIPKSLRLSFPSALKPALVLPQGSFVDP